MIADSYDPAWLVEVDGGRRSVERVNGDFLGCVLEPGTHEVRFVFHPMSIYYGLRLSFVGLFLALLCAIVSALSWLAATRSGEPKCAPLRVAANRKITPLPCVRSFVDANEIRKARASSTASPIAEPLHVARSAS